MNNLIYIQAQDATTVIQASLSENGRWVMKFGRNRIFSVTEELERKYCTLVYTPYYSNKGDIARWLQGNYEGLGPDEIDDFVAQFKMAHPLTKSSSPQLETLLATDEDGYCVLSSPTFRGDVKLSAKRERDLVEIIWAERIAPDFPVSVAYKNKLDALESYFDWHCGYYGVTTKYKRDANNAGVELAYHFCLLHGFNENWLECSVLSCARTKNDLRPEDREPRGWFGATCIVSELNKEGDMSICLGWVSFLIGLLVLILKFLGLMN